MGIRGLSSFIQNRSEDYLKNHILRNTAVVIDGNNFYHFLFLNSPRRNACFGGDYTYFRDYAEQVLLFFKQCNIIPIIIFDGGLDMNDRKQQTRLSRARQKIVSSLKIKPSNQDRMSVFPLLLRMVLTQLLKKHKVETIQCKYEADNEIAALARGMNCPVISNDSDFYVMDVQVIPLSLIDLSGAVKLSEGYGLECKAFSMSDFLVSIGHKDASIFPLLGTLLGNDYVDKNLFEAIFSQIRMPKTKKMNEQHRKVQGLLDFLKGQNVEEAVERILKFIKKTHHAEVENAIQISLEAYANETTACLNSPQDLKEKVVAGVVSHNLPEWFATLYSLALVPPWVLEVTISHRMPFQSQVECTNLSHSFISCSDLLQVIALVCWNGETDDNKLMTHWRKNGELIFKRFRLTKMDFAVDLPKISSVVAMTLEDKQKLLFDVILEQKSGLIQEQPAQLRLIFATIIHWARHSYCRVRSFHIDGLIASVIHFYVIEKKLGKVRNTKRLDKIAASKAGTDLDDYIKVAKNTIKFHEVDTRMMTHDVNYDKEIVHVLAEFQATYYLAHTLGQILDVNLPTLSPFEFYCGTFIYQAVSHFKGFNRLTLADKLYGKSDAFSSFKLWTDFIYELSPASLMEWSPHGPNKPKKRNKRNGNNQQKEETVAQSSSSPPTEEESDQDATNLMANRFGVLSIS